LCPVNRFSSILPPEATMKEVLGKIAFGAAVRLASAVVASHAQINPGFAPEPKRTTGWIGGDQPSQTGQSKISETTG
jgi:hypothetical protein